MSLIKYLADHIGIVWAAISPFLYIWIGAWLTRRSQSNHWLRDKKLQEYSELLDTLLERKEDILWNKSGGPIEAVDPRDQAERDKRFFAVGRMFQNRLFIDKPLTSVLTKNDPSLLV
jgi:hypothetical protein